MLDLTSHTSAIENLGWALGVPSVCAYLAQGTFEVPVPDLRRASLEAVELADGEGV